MGSPSISFNNVWRLCLISVRRDVVGAFKDDWDDEDFGSAFTMLGALKRVTGSRCELVSLFRTLNLFLAPSIVNRS